MSTKNNVLCIVAKAGRFIGPAATAEFERMVDAMDEASLMALENVLHGLQAQYAESELNRISEYLDAVRGY